MKQHLEKERNRKETAYHLFHTLARPSHIIKTPGSNYIAVLTAARAV